MKVVLQCNTVINDQKIPGRIVVGSGKNKKTEKTCLELPEQEARAAINRQHAKLATASDAINHKLSQAE